MVVSATMKTLPVVQEMNYPATGLVVRHVPRCFSRDIIEDLFGRIISRCRGRWKFYYVHVESERLYRHHIFSVYWPYAEKGTYGPADAGIFYIVEDFAFNPELKYWSEYQQADARHFYSSSRSSKLVLVPPAWNTLRYYEKNAAGGHTGKLRRQRLVKMCEYAHARPLEPWDGF